MIVPRVLYGASVMFGLVGVALRVRAPLPPAIASPLTPPLAAGARNVGATREDADAYEPIAAADVFSPTRTPPAVRFTPDQTTERPAPTPPIRRAKGVEPSVHLFGIVTMPSGAIALLSAPGVPGTKMYRTGDRVGGGSVTAITDSTVVVARRSGSLVLRLPSGKTKRP